MSLAFQRLEGTCLLLTIKTQHGLSCFQDITYEYLSRRYAEVAEWVEENVWKLTAEDSLVYIGAPRVHFTSVVKSYQKPSPYSAPEHLKKNLRGIALH